MADRKRFGLLVAASVFLFSIIVGVSTKSIEDGYDNEKLSLSEAFGIYRRNEAIKRHEEERRRARPRLSIYDSISTNTIPFYGRRAGDGRLDYYINDLWNWAREINSADNDRRDASFYEGRPMAFRESTGSKRPMFFREASDDDFRPFSRESDIPMHLYGRDSSSFNIKRERPMAFREARRPMLFREASRPMAFREAKRPMFFREAGRPMAFREAGRPMAFREAGRPMAFREAGRPMAFREAGRPMAFREAGRPMAFREASRPMFFREADAFPRWLRRPFRRDADAARESDIPMHLFGRGSSSFKAKRDRPMSIFSQRSAEKDEQRREIPMLSFGRRSSSLQKRSGFPPPHLGKRAIPMHYFGLRRSQ